MAVAVTPDGGRSSGNHISATNTTQVFLDAAQAKKARDVIKLGFKYGKETGGCLQLIGYLDKIPAGLNYLPVHQANPKLVAHEVSNSKAKLEEVVKNLRLDEACNKEGILLLVEVIAGPYPHEIAVQQAVKVGATQVVLESKMAGHNSYFQKALSCGVLRLRARGGVEIIRSLALSKLSTAFPRQTPEQTSSMSLLAQQTISQVPAESTTPMKDTGHDTEELDGTQGRRALASGSWSFSRHNSWHGQTSSGTTSCEVLYNKKYDVFITHRGTLKNGFVGYLDAAFHNRQVQSFLDRKDLGVGEYISDSLKYVIKQVPVGLVIFTADFAESWWCLEELHLMLQNPTTRVLPVFYDVRPGDVRHPGNGQLKAGWNKSVCREQVTSIDVDRWRAALELASDIVGWEYSSAGKMLEADLMKEVVFKVMEILPRRSSFHERVIDVIETHQRSDSAPDFLR